MSIILYYSTGLYCSYVQNRYEERIEQLEAENARKRVGSARPVMNKSTSGQSIAIFGLEQPTAASPAAAATSLNLRERENSNTQERLLFGELIERETQTDFDAGTNTAIILDWMLQVNSYSAPQKPPPPSIKWCAAQCAPPGAR